MKILFVLLTTIIILLLLLLLLKLKRTSLTSYHVDGAKKYMICMPQGGIIDMCNSILRCHKYCIRHDRILIIDTTKGWFNDDINKYLNFNSPNIYVGDPTDIKLQGLSVYPRGIDIQKLKDPEIRPNTDSPGHQFFLDNISLTYDLSLDYSEQVLVYSMYRLGDANFNEFLSLVSFKPLVLDAYNKARNRLPENYISVHVRNTDYESNVDKFIEEHTEDFAHKNIFVASDNKNTISTFKRRYGSKIYNFTDLPENDGKPLHDKSLTIRNKEESQKYNIETFVDILLLASADEYFYSSKQSGFSQSIVEMRNNKELLRRITN
jgi:hypothetical protein